MHSFSEGPAQAKHRFSTTFLTSVHIEKQGLCNVIHRKALRKSYRLYKEALNTLFFLFL